MSRSDLTLFKEKYNLDNYFISVIESLFEKLVEFEYIPHSKLSHFTEKLYNNISEIRFGKTNSYDYKSGYYDANKKELYINDKKNIPAIFLRLLYALTTKEIDTNVYTVGYSTTKLRKDSYKLSYTNFGINRAIMSNLVYKLCNLVPASLQITPTNNTYTHDFLGFKIESANDIYALEGKLLAETCFVLDIDIELLYAGLFSKSPIKYLDNVFEKKNFEHKDEFLSLFDDISRKYNTYNKLCFLSKKLNDNYIEYKKHALNDDKKDILKEQEIIENHIRDVIYTLYKNNTNTAEELQEDEEFELSVGLSETLESLETELKTKLVEFQDILADNIIKNNTTLPHIKYANKLKCFNDILIVPNREINKAIQDTILFKLMPEDEVTGINLIQKMKYAIIEQILANREYTDISNSFSFYNITNLEDSDLGTALILLKSDKGFAKLVEISGLEKSISKSSEFGLKYIPLDNLKHMLTNTYSNTYIGNIEKLYTALKQNLKEFANVPLDNIFAFDYNNNHYLVIYNGGKMSVLSYAHSSQGYGFNNLTLSEQYKVFGKTVIHKNNLITNLPILYKNKS